MLTFNKAFSSFSVNDLDKAKTFYSAVLGLPVTQSKEGLSIKVSNDYAVFLYPKPNHEPATFTVLNFQVANIDDAVDRLTEQGVAFQHYDQGQIKTDKKGVARDSGGPQIAWFADPAGNIISVVEDHYRDGRQAP